MRDRRCAASEGGTRGHLPAAESSDFSDRVFDEESGVLSNIRRFDPDEAGPSTEGPDGRIRRLARGPGSAEPCPVCGYRVPLDDHAVHYRGDIYHPECVLYRRGR